MRGLSFILLIILSVLMTACDSTPEEYRIPGQAYVRALESVEGDTGSIYGKLLFPSEFSQRSLTFSLNDRSFYTMTDGRFRVEEIPFGEHTLTVLSKGYEPIQLKIRVGEKPLNMGALQLKMARGQVIGRLVDGSGKSAANIRVLLMPNGGVSVTDGDGIFQFIGVNRGDHTFTLKDKQYFTFNRTVQVQTGERLNLGNIKVFPRAQPPVQNTARMPGE